MFLHITIIEYFVSFVTHSAKGVRVLPCRRHGARSDLTVKLQRCRFMASSSIYRSASGSERLGALGCSGCEVKARREVKHGLALVLPGFVRGTVLSGGHARIASRVAFSYAAHRRFLKRFPMDCFKKGSPKGICLQRHLLGRVPRGISREIAPGVPLRRLPSQGLSRRCLGCLLLLLLVGCLWFRCSAVHVVRPLGLWLQLSSLGSPRPQIIRRRQRTNSRQADDVIHPPAQSHRLGTAPLR